MTVRVGINGFGRIGRNFFRAAKASGADIDFVAANDLGDLETMAHLLRYDSVHGKLPYEVEVIGDAIKVDGDLVVMTSERDPSKLLWGDMDVDVVIESTGFFRKREDAAKHLEAGAKQVIISAPAKCDATIVMGVNEHEFDAAEHKIISNASCTTNCLSPMMKVLDDTFGLDKGFMTTVHAYTGDQSIVDGPHPDLRRSRAAAVNIVPTSTGAATATSQVLPQLAGKLDGIAMRVPVPSGSMTDFTGVVSRDTTVEEVNAAFAAAAAEGPLSKVLAYTDEPIVSSDIVGHPASCIFDSGLTQVNGNLVKIAGWYDNEWGYSSRLVDLALMVGNAGK